MFALYQGCVSRWGAFRRAEVFEEALEGAGIEAGPRHLSDGLFAVWRLNACSAAARGCAGEQRRACRSLGGAYFRTGRSPMSWAAWRCPSDRLASCDGAA
jgi:hypothetical protein